MHNEYTYIEIGTEGTLDFMTSCFLFAAWPKTAQRRKESVAVDPAALNMFAQSLFGGTVAQKPLSCSDAGSFLHSPWLKAKLN